jgi:hypothetical protein
MKYMVAELQFIAKKAWYENGMICISLEDGREIRFPAYLSERLKQAPVASLGNIEVICNGTGLHWPDLGEDLSVQRIMEGRFGNAG